MKQKLTVEIWLIPILTLVIWVGCVIVGAAGLPIWNRNSGVPASQPSAPPLVPQTLDVTITQDEEVIADDSPPPDVPQPMESPPAPPLPMVAMPSAAIAFAQEIEGPARIVPALSAVPAVHPKDASPAPIRNSGQPRIQRLTLDKGAGQSVVLEYPDEAARAAQQGSVIVIFTVGDSGKVTEAHLSPDSHCRWPILNQAALRSIRKTQFPSGTVGVYELECGFALQQQP